MDSLHAQAQHVIDRCLPGRRVADCHDRGTWIQQTIILTLDVGQALLTRLKNHLQAIELLS